MNKKLRRSPLKPQPPAHLLQDSLEKVDRWVSQNRWQEAYQELSELDLRFPEQPEVLLRLADASLELKLMRNYQVVLERLVKLEPDDSDLALSLASAYAINNHTALAIRQINRFLERWSDHAQAGKARQMLAQLEDALAQTLAGMNLPEEQARQLALQHEEMQALMESHQIQAAFEIGKAIVQQYPQFVSTWLNLSRLYWHEGHLDQAVECLEKALENEPESVPALARLVCIYAQRGEEKAAQENAQRLKAIQPSAPDQPFYIAEALSYVGDAEGVLAAFEQARKMDLLKEKGEKAAKMVHLAAVAHLQQGNESQARRLWEQALRLCPGFKLAEDHLEDLQRPPGERNAPWAFEIQDWIPFKQLESALRLMDELSAEKDDPLKKNLAKRFFRQHPNLLKVIPALLERGDDHSRRFAIVLAGWVDDAEILQAMVRFAVGQRGSDRLRMEAAKVALEAGLLPSGELDMWYKGQKRTLFLMGIRLSPAKESKHEPPVSLWLTEASRALANGRYEQAEQSLRQALEVKPDAADILHNLAVTLQRQGREEEAEGIQNRLVEQFPDYPFARTSLAIQCARRGELERAEELLRPLRYRRQATPQEFNAMCAAHVELYLASQQYYLARMWLQLWEENEPQQPQLKDYRALLDAYDRLAKTDYQWKDTKFPKKV